MDGYDQETGEVNDWHPDPPTTQQLAVSQPPMQNLISASPECGEVFGALCDMQGQMDAPKRTKSAKVKGRTKNGAEYEYSYDYAPLDEIIKTVKKPMAATGLAYRQFLAHRGNQSVVRTVIAHKSGQWMLTDYPIFWDESRGMQGFASGVTYARRYGLMLALGVAAEDDDDANVADGQPATVADRSQGRSRGRTAQEGLPRAAVEQVVNQRFGSVAPQQPTAAPANASKDDAIAKHRAVVEVIDNAVNVMELDELTGGEDSSMASDQWKEMCNAIHAADPGEKGNNVIAKLRQRAEDRKTLLFGDEPRYEV